LFSDEDNVWKLGDFGLVTEGTSTTAKTTTCARGTECYRAPELLREPSLFNSKTDIWALGCILYELVFSKKAFVTDFALFELMLSHEQFRLPFETLSSIDEISTTRLSTVLSNCLDLDFQRRATAEQLLIFFNDQLNHPSSFSQTSTALQEPQHEGKSQDVDSSPLLIPDINALSLTKSVSRSVDGQFALIIEPQSRPLSTNSNYNRSTSYGTNSRGNSYAGTGNAYRYSNRDGSYFYKNSNGSTYYNDGKGYSEYTP
jgi:serine/threonine protein kinase